MLFEGINRIYRDYGVFDYPRSGGSRHNGMDIDGVNSFVIRMPSFNGKTISGTVTRSRIVTDHSDSTWEWGYYVTVKLSTPQTVDGTAIHYLTFAHNARNLVSDGDTVTTGTPLARFCRGRSVPRRRTNLRSAHGNTARSRCCHRRGRGSSFRAAAATRFRRACRAESHPWRPCPNSGQPNQPPRRGRPRRGV